MNDYVSKKFEDYREKNGLPADAELELYFDPDSGDFKVAPKGTVQGSFIEIPTYDHCW